MGFIDDYIASNKNSGKWLYRIPSEQNKLPFWINHDVKKVSLIYPMLDGLKVKLEAHKKELGEKIKTGPILKDTEIFCKMLKIDNKDKLAGLLNKNRVNFVSKFMCGKLLHDEASYKYYKKNENASMFIENLRLEKESRSKGPPSMLNVIGQSYNMKAFSSKLTKGFSRKEVMDFLFFNFFKLEIGEGKKKAEFFKNVETEQMRSVIEKMANLDSTKGLTSDEVLSIGVSLMKVKTIYDTADEYYVEQICEKIKEIDKLYGQLADVNSDEFNFDSENLIQKRFGSHNKYYKDKYSGVLANEEDHASF